MVNGRQHRVEEKVCQSKSLGSQSRNEERELVINGAQPRRDMKALQALEE